MSQTWNALRCDTCAALAAVASVAPSCQCDDDEDANAQSNDVPSPLGRDDSSPHAQHRLSSQKYPYHCDSECVSVCAEFVCGVRLIRQHGTPEQRARPLSSFARQLTNVGRVHTTLLRQYSTNTIIAISSTAPSPLHRQAPNHHSSVAHVNPLRSPIALHTRVRSAHGASKMGSGFQGMPLYSM